MISLDLPQLLLMISPLLLIEGFYSGSEIALLSADKLTLQKQSKEGDSAATLALEMSNHPERVLSTTLLLTSLSVITISGLIALYFLKTGSTYPDLKAILVTSPLVVLLGELIPKTIYQKNSNTLARWVAYPIYLTYLTFFPITRLLASYTTRLSRMVVPIEELFSGKRKSTREDIRALLSYNKKETEIKTSEKRMIKKIFDFRTFEAKHALIPLIRVDAIEESSTVQMALEHFERHRHSRMPVFNQRIYNIIGVLEISDLLSATDLQQPIQPYLTPAHYVSETQSLEGLMLDMRSEDNEMVIVVNEHGGAVGILTIEDIVEEIVGEISDEFDSDSLPYKTTSETSWIVQARMEIQQINEILQLELPQGNYETLSGFLLQQFGRIPEPSDELFFDTPNGSYKFTIQKATERHIESVLINRIKTE